MQQIVGLHNLTSAYEQAIGAYHPCYLDGITTHNAHLPTWAYYAGYSFISFISFSEWHCHVDLYALVDPEGRVIKIWPGKAPSLTQLWEALGEKANEKMRKEDEVRLPPKLKLKLPQGYHIERKPGEYILYHSYPVGPRATMTDLVAVFPKDVPPDEIIKCAQEHSQGREMKEGE